ASAFVCLSLHPRRHLPGRVFPARRLAQTREKATAGHGDTKSTSSHSRSNKGGSSMKIIKAVYNFIVGDMVILVGVLLTVVVLALINNVSALAPLKDFSGPFLVLGVLSSLVATLLRHPCFFNYWLTLY